MHKSYKIQTKHTFDNINLKIGEIVMSRFSYSTPNTEGAGQLVDDTGGASNEEVIPLAGIALLEKEKQEREVGEGGAGTEDDPENKPELGPDGKPIVVASVENEDTEIKPELGPDGKPVVEEKSATEDEKVPVKTPEQINAEIIAKAQADFAKSLGFDNPEDLKKVVNQSKNVAETEEQKVARIEKYNKELAAYAITNSLLTPQDLTSIESLQKSDDRGIALNDFAADYRADNKDRKDDDGNPDPVTEDEINKAFEDLYHTDSSNPTLKNKGEKLMKEKADSIRSVANQKFDNAKQKFDIEQEKGIQIPAYKTFVQSTISESIPEKIKISGDGDDAVYFSTVSEQGKPLYDKDKLEALFKKNELFNIFLTGDKSQLKQAMAETIEEHIFKENRAAINTLLLTHGESVGLKKGSNVGANAPFEANKQKPVPVNEKGLSPEAKEHMRKRYGGKIRV